MRRARVMLASLPWATYGEPSLGLALLKATLNGAAIPCRACHLNLGLLRYLTPDTYSMLASFWGINEFLFTGVLDAQFDRTQAACLVERCALHAPEVQQERYRSTEALLGLCMQLRDDIMPQYLEECAERILAQRPTLVGFSCMFDQTLASAALARRLKARAPELMVVLGGYALEGAPGDTVLRSFPWIDAIARGDGEPQIARLAQASVGTDRLAGIPGVLARGEDHPAAPPLQADLNAAAVPDYDDWFNDLDALQRSDQLIVRTTVLPVEASRGCWWGQHKHCIFCGIDEDTLKYRAKEQHRVLAMLHTMRRRYGDHIFRFSDYILPKQYYHDMLDELAATTPRFRLMGEIKANQSAERLRRFAAAGFVELQPGVESFSSEVLKLMDKGVRGIHNAQTLKAGYANRIQINYNILYGLPNERPDWYRAVLRQLPKLYHLTPPVSRTETVVTRYAPLQANPARFGLTVKPRHHRCYDVFFSAAFYQSHPFSLDDYAYYFARNFDYGDELAGLYAMLVTQVQHWKKQHRERDVYLHYRDRPEQDALDVCDTRFGAERRIRLSGLERLLYLACDDAPTTQAALAERTGAGAGGGIDAALSMLADEYRLLWREGEHYYGLAVPSTVWEAHRQSGWTHSWTASYC